MAGAEGGEGTHGSCSLLRRSRVGSGTARVSRTPRPLCRRPPPRTRLSRQERHSALSGRGSHPTCHPQGQHSQGKHHPAPCTIPLPAPSLRFSTWHRSKREARLPPTLRGSARVSVGTTLWDSPRPSLTDRARPPLLPPAGTALRAGGEPAEDTGGCQPGPGGQGGSMAPAKAERSLPQC